MPSQWELTPNNRLELLSTGMASPRPLTLHSTGMALPRPLTQYGHGIAAPIDPVRAWHCRAH